MHARDHEREPLNRAQQSWLAAASAVGLTGVFVLSGRYGFDFTDNGFVLAQAAKVLRGEVPHVGIWSPRPLGSAVLHTVDLLLPGPRFLLSRAIALLEIVGYSILLARISLRRRAISTSAAAWAAVAAATAVNLHTFPLMAWHTIDGVLLVSLAFTCLGRDGHPSPKAAAFAGALSGFAALTKQSFAPAVLVTLLVCARRARSEPLRRQALAMAALGAAAPLILYGGWVTSAGGLGTMWRQLTNSGGVSPLAGFIPRDMTTSRVALVVATIFLGASVGRLRSSRARTYAAAAFIAALALVPLSAQLSIGGGWGAELLIIATLVRGAQIASDRNVEWPDLAMLVIAWMASLSWGYAVPDLVAGSVALHVGAVVAAEAELPSLPARRIGAAACAFSVLLVAVMATVVRRGEVYRDRPARELSVDLGTVAPAGRGIRTGPVVAQLARAIADCSRRFATDAVVLAPDGAAAYPLLDLRNPLAEDWPIDDERGRIDDALRQELRRLRGTGAIVLLETFPLADLAQLDVLPDVDQSATPLPSSMSTAVVEELGPPTATCGPLLVVQTG